MRWLFVVAGLVAMAAPAEAQQAGCVNNTPCTQTNSFQPTGAKSLAVTNASASTALPTTGGNLTLFVTNIGTAVAYVALGGVSVVATTSSPPIQPGQAVAFGQGANSYIAAITASGTASLLLQSGTGVPVVTYGAGSATVTTASGAAAPATFTISTVSTVTTASGALYTYGTPAKTLILSNNGAATVWLQTVGTAGGNCNTAVSGQGIPLAPGGGSVAFGSAALPLPTCAVTAISASGSNSVSLAGV